MDQKTVSFPQRALFCAAIVFLISLAVYCWTLAPTVTLTDSGELMVVARFLGVAHPPGVPLWTILAHLTSLLPWGTVASRINFSSAIFAASAAAMLTLTVVELMTISSATQKKTNDRLTPGYLNVLLPAVGAGLLLAFSRTLWSYATITEVYALNTLLVVTILFLMVRWRRCVLAHRKIRSGDSSALGNCDLLLYSASAVFGLALGVHHVTVALILPALALLVYKTERGSFFVSRRLLYAALCSTLALLAIYSYLPLAASRDPAINWGNPRSLQEIWWHVSGRQYQVFLEFSLKSIGAQTLQFGRMALREFGWPWVPLSLVLAFLGFADLWKRDRTGFWMVALVIAANLAYALTYEIAEDKDAYYLPAFIAIAIAAGFGLRWLISIFAARIRSSAIVGAASGTVIAVVSVLIAFSGNWAFNNRRHYFVAHDYVDNVLNSMEPNGLLLTFDWQVVSPMFYTREVELRRPETRVIDVNLLRRPWYFRYLRHAWPELVARSAIAIEPFEKELDAWEHDPQLYATDPERNRRINTLFHEMLRAIVTNEGAIGPVYFTLDLLWPEQRDAELSRWLNQNYQFVPRGLVFQLTNDSTFQDLPEMKLELRGLADGTLRFDSDDPVTLKILPAYTGMLINRGRYLSFNNQPGRAIAAYEQALRLDSNLSFPKQEIEKERTKLVR